MAIAKLWSDLISQIPLDLVSSKLILNCLQNCCCKHSWHYPQTVPPKSNPAPKSHSQSRLDPLASSLSPTDEILRANTFPEVTDLFCQLPLPIFFYQPKDALLVIRFHGIRSLRRKENSSQGSCQRLPVQLRYHKSFPKGPEYPRSCSGILTPFLFNKWPMIAHFEMEFPFLLGSTNLCPTDVHVEPFSTSFFKVLIWIYGTTTNICTRGRFTQAHAKGFTKTPTPSCSSELCYLLWRLKIGTTLQRHPF